MQDLQDTVALMNSEDYKDRFKAEYLQTKLRYDRLCAMIVKCEVGALNFTPSRILGLLSKQARAMSEYLHCLEVRAQVEQIEL